MNSGQRATTARTWIAQTHVAQSNGGGEGFGGWQVWRALILAYHTVVVRSIYVYNM